MHLTSSEVTTIVAHLPTLAMLTKVIAMLTLIAMSDSRVVQTIALGVEMEMIVVRLQQQHATATHAQQEWSSCWPPINWHKPTRMMLSVVIHAHVAGRRLAQQASSRQAGACQQWAAQQTL